MDNTVEEEEEEPEAEGGGSKEGDGEGDPPYWRIGVGEVWLPEWGEGWDTYDGWPTETPVYEPEVVNYKRWSDIIIIWESNNHSRPP